MNHVDQNLEVEDDVNLEELVFVPSAVSEPRGAFHFVRQEVQRKVLHVV